MNPQPLRVELRQNYWMFIALGAVWLFTTFTITWALIRHGEWTRLAVFGVASLLYLAHTGGVFSSYYRRKHRRGYFRDQLAILAVIVASVPQAQIVWFLLLPAAAQAVMYLPTKQLALVLAAQLAIGCVPAFYLPKKYVSTYFTNAAMGTLFSLGCSYAIRREFESRRQLHEAHEKLRAHSEQAEALAAAEERNRLAREIHDGVAHHLTSANVLIEAGTVLLPADAPAAAVDSLKKAQQQVRSALGELRESIAGRTHPLSSAELPIRIQDLITNGNFPAVLSLSGSHRRVAGETEQALFRVAQEALTNASKHAPGRPIRLVLDYSSSHHVSLTSQNEAPAQIASGDGAFGLLSLRERMRRVGGTFYAGQETGGVFIVRAEIPA